MADFSALKTSIQNYIKQNGNEEITGNLLQQILLSMVTTLGDSAINDLVTALNAEIANRGNADTTLQGNIDNEATARGNADTELGGRITTLQGVVNGLVANVENGYVYAGIATPSTTPVSGKVFYLALTAGTYTNFGATEVPQGINILKYNGSAWSLDSFLGLDDAPTQGSSNLVKSGGVLDSIIKDGSAFDLSAYNNGTTYADLSAALTALNALSAAYKKGGMSFKYVQTSDNNYIQARCIANEFTTDVTKWQGVVEEIKTKSNNLITSGGVAKNLDIVEFENEEAVLSFEDLYHRVVEYINKYGEHVFLNKCLMSSLSVDGKDVDMAAISAIELQESEEWGLVLLDKSNRIIKGVLKTGETIDFNIHAEEKQRYITTWGDSLTAQGGWNDYISLMSDLPLHNCGVGGEDVPTICSRQGADSFIINNITIPANGGTVKIADWNNKLQTQLGKLTTPLLQGGGDSFNPVYVNGKAMTLAYTGDFFQSIEGDWVLSNNTNEGAIVIDRPTSIITTQDKEFNAPYLMVIFIGTNGGYSSISELIDYHKYMINHAKATNYLVLGFSFGTAASQADYEAEMKTEFGRYFVSLREYLSTPIYEDGNIVSCYGLADQNVEVDPTYTYDGKTTIEEIELGMVPHQILQDAVHFTSGTQRVIGEMLYKKCIELNIF